MPLRALGAPCGPAGEYGCRGGEGVDRVGLAVRPAGPSVGPVHLDHGDLVRPQGPGEFGAVGPRALDTDGDDLPVRAQPVQESAIAVRSSGKGLGGQVPTDGVDHCCLVEVGMGVDAADHRYLVCHAGWAVLPCDA